MSLALRSAESESGLTSAETAVILYRRQLLDRAVSEARVPDVTETEIQRLIGDCSWMFGGRYVGVAPRRELLQLEENDLPLFRLAGSLHIVELKGPFIPSLIKKHRNHWIVGNAIREATMQATNYVRTADELGASAERNLREELGIDVDLRGVFATVVIGHRDHLVAGDMPEEQFDVAPRTYNAAMNRVQVVTYDQLFDAAARSLVFDGT
jgi:predicted Zn-dependent protease with MMP-like domain